MVGTSGAMGERSSEPTASIFNLPARPWGNATGRFSNVSWTSPAMSPVVAIALPLNGTCTMSTPVRSLNCSPAIWPVAPAPEVP